MDFCQEQLVPESRIFGVYRKAKTWTFPMTPNSVLAFQEKYTSGSLKSIYLNAVSKEILQYLKKNCPNLEIISVLCPSATNSLLEEIPLPKTIQVCELSFDENRVLSRGGVDQCTLLLLRLENCTNLHRLTLRKMTPSPDGITALSNLRKITDLSFLQVRLPRLMKRACDVDKLNTALVSLLKLAKLRAFRLSTDSPYPTQAWFNIDKFLSAIQDGIWPNLKVLVLVGIKPPSPGIFALMTSVMPQLETLELEGEIITDENIGLTAKHLKNITSVVFTNGNYTPAGIKSLSAHPSIEKLSLLEHHQMVSSPQWLLAVYDVLLSLPKVAYVKLIGFRIIALHAKEQGIPQMPKHVQMDVENSDEFFNEIIDVREVRLD